MKYRKKPIVIHAVQYDGNFRCLDVFSIHEVKNFIVGTDDAGNPCLKIPTLEGVMIASKGDYIIRGVKGEYYPCKPDIFEMTYELEEKVVLESHNPISSPINKEEQKKLITEIMEEDAKDGLYGSKGSDENFKQFSLYEHKETITSADTITSSQTEISDEEIEKEAKQTYREHPNNPKEHTDWTYGKDVNFARKQKAFIKGAKWYREQLKSKQ